MGLRKTTGMKATSGVVTGRVQRVGFRWLVVDGAQKLGVTRHVKKDDDGSVEVFAQGEAPLPDSVFAWLRGAKPPSRLSINSLMSRSRFAVSEVPYWSSFVCMALPISCRSVR
jgi:acylphosphatase